LIVRLDSNECVESLARIAPIRLRHLPPLRRGREARGISWNPSPIRRGRKARGISLESFSASQGKESARHQPGILPPLAGEGGGSRKGAIHTKDVISLQRRSLRQVSAVVGLCAGVSFQRSVQRYCRWHASHESPTRLTIGASAAQVFVPSPRSATALRRRSLYSRNGGSGVPSP